MIYDEVCAEHGFDPVREMYDRWLQFWPQRFVLGVAQAREEFL